ncbi:MAG: bis(5'-nucleosyl)-tetraphosphatase (symmetrical) YqeK, partial [Clostridia bacterium]|nr:bis(5'-nucleosyl)-tetraphosphatase (symmetrical) YqeK [Clostridia bacterium]
YAKRQKADESAAFTAAMLHDAAKYLDEKDFGYFIPTDVPEPVKHQFLGAYIAQSVLDVGDKDVINAIRYHTTGRPAMSTLEKIIFLADLLEQGRTFPEVDELRKAVDDDFERGFKLCVSRLYDYLSASGQPVYYLTKQAKDYYENA